MVAYIKTTFVPLLVLLLYMYTLSQYIFTPPFIITYSLDILGRIYKTNVGTACSS